MLGIKEIASYIPEKRTLNQSKKEKFDITDEFIRDKIGVNAVAVKSIGETCSSMCVRAFERLREKPGFKPVEIDALIVVTQNPDFNIPHVSAIVHGELDISPSCACFDISLGCSGFVYALSTIISFMEANGMKNGLLFTSDQYSDIIDADDKNTALIFGDAASVTYIAENPVYAPIDFTFGTIGKSYKDLLCDDKMLFMNGRAIYNFACKVVPEDVRKLLDRNSLNTGDIDAYIFHQGTKFIVDSLAKRLELDPAKVAFDMLEYGNTCSSSIPMILEKYLGREECRKVLISGFGVGLSWSNAILKRV